MTNIFQQPYTLIGLSVIVLFGVFTYRSVFPERANRKQWLIPLSVLALAFGLDFIVRTDREKVSSLLNAFMEAVEQENTDAITPLVAPDYNDSYHPDKAALVAHCRRTLSNIHIRKITKTAGRIPPISSPTVKTTLFVTAKFEENSWVTQTYKSFLFFKGDIHAAKQPDNTWKITKITPREVDKQPITWSHIRH